MVAKPKKYSWFLDELNKVKIDANYDIPYFAGYNWNNTKIYIDRDVPKTITLNKKKFDLHKSLAIHEFVEKYHINEGYTYAAAHEIAIKYERAFVLSKGVSWKEYDFAVAKLMHQNWMSKLESVPKDLDMTPMEYSRDLKTLAKVRRLLIRK